MQTELTTLLASLRRDYSGVSREKESLEEQLAGLQRDHKALLHSHEVQCLELSGVVAERDSSIER